MLYFVIAIALIAGSMAWQHFRYLYLRRKHAEDQQRTLHSTEAFHVLTFFKARNESKVVASARQFTQLVTANSKGRLIYAGEATTLLSSKQLGERDWNGVIMIEYRNRQAFQDAAVQLNYTAAREIFADSYVHGMRRNRRLSMAMPQRLLQLRLRNILTGRWRLEPLVPHEVLTEFKPGWDLDTWRTGVNRLLALHEVNRSAVVIFSLVKRGERKNRSGNDVYNIRMFSRMASLDHGPLHLGRGVTLEGSAVFDSVFVVHYPSARYFADLLGSQFFHSIVGAKHTNDTLAVPTVPITDRIANRE